MTKGHRLLGMVVGVFLLTSGCTGIRPFRVNVNALRDAHAPDKRTYVLYPGLKDVEPTDLQFREFAGYVDRDLQSRGLTPAHEGSRADIVIFLSYGIGDPQTTYYTYPIFGQISGGTSTFSASTYGPGGYARTTGTVTSSPQYGVVGTDTVRRTWFFRWAALEAVDVDAFLKTQKVVPLWRTSMGSSGSSGDLRLVFPVMIAAGQPYIASNTRNQVRRFLREKSREVVSIRGENQR